MKLVTAVLMLGLASVTWADSPVCNQPGENYVGWPTVDPVWEMCYLKVSDSSAAQGSSLEIRKVHFNGYLAMERIHMPMLFASYETSTCYRDWKDAESDFLKANQVENPTQSAITTCDASTEPNEVVGDCPFNDPNGSGQIGNGADCVTGVQIEKYDDRMVLTTNHSAAWYKYTSRYIFHADGRIQPRFGFGNSTGNSNSINHWHTGYWRINFDIDGADDDEVFIGDAMGDVLQTEEFSDWRHDTSGPGEPVALTDKSWLVKDKNTGRGYRVVPETEGDAQQGKVDEFALTSDPSGRGFHNVDVMATRYKLINGSLTEYSDTPGQNSLSNCSMDEDQLVGQSSAPGVPESMVDENPVFWYRTAVWDQANQGMLCKTGGPTLYPVGDWGLDQAPVAVADSISVDENSVDNALDVMVNDTDDGIGDQFVESVEQPDDGAVVIGLDGLHVEYTPVTDYCNNGVVTDDFTYTLNGGSSATVSMTVNCLGLNDIIFVNDFE